MVIGGLCALRSVIKKYEYGDKESWKTLDGISNTVFPLLEEMLVKIVEFSGNEGATKA